MAVGTTPTVETVVRTNGEVHAVRLKIEAFNNTGSVKDRTAAGLVRALDEQSPLRAGDVVIESTSGNLGLALADLVTARGCRFVAVVDLNTPIESRRALAAAGAELVVVDEPDGRGGYLLSRLRKVRELCARHPAYRWPDQYTNSANPAVHEQETGPELVEQSPGLDAVYIAVSTGGTLAGVSRHLRAVAPQVRIVAVDAEGSLVTGDRVGKRLLSGIGASRPSRFLAPGAYDDVVQVADVDAFAVCRMLFADTGLLLGGSSGSVVRACLHDLAQGGPPAAPVCLCPDGGQKYLDNFYADEWLSEHDLLGPVLERIRGFRESGLVFERGGADVAC
jgi:2,3-diaminopropionate biosynthesis protein SbnA